MTLWWWGGSWRIHLPLVRTPTAWPAHLEINIQKAYIYVYIRSVQRYGKIVFSDKSPLVFNPSTVIPAITQIFYLKSNLCRDSRTQDVMFRAVNTQKYAALDNGWKPLQQSGFFLVFFVDKCSSFHLGRAAAESRRYSRPVCACASDVPRFSSRSLSYSPTLGSSYSNPRCH